MEKDYIIISASTKHARDIHKVLLSAFMKYCDLYTPNAFKDTILSEKMIKERLMKMKIYIVTTQNEEIIGTIGLQKISREEGHILGMAVIPERQGNNSPAKDLLKKVEIDAKLEGY